MNRKKRVIPQVSEAREEIREKKGLTCISKKKKRNCKNQEKKKKKRATSTINDHDNEVVRSFKYLDTVMMEQKKNPLTIPAANKACYSLPTLFRSKQIH